MNRHDRRKRLTEDRHEIQDALHRMLPSGYELRHFGHELESLGPLEYAACASCGTKQTGLNVTRTGVTWTSSSDDAVVGRVLVYAYAFICKACLGDAQKVYDLATRLIVTPMERARAAKEAT